MQRNLACRVARLGQTSRLSATSCIASSSRSFISSPYRGAQAADAAQPSASTSPNSKAAPPPPATANDAAHSTSNPASASTSSSTSTTSSSSPKISTIVDQIEGLTLLEASELVTLLKTRLNITEIAMPSAAAAPVAAATPAAAPAEEEKPKEKTIFTVKLMGLKEPTAKAKVIKEVKALNSQMNLVEAKKFVESAPQVLKEGLTKEEAEKLQKAVETAGGMIELE